MRHVATFLIQPSATSGFARSLALQPHARLCLCLCSLRFLGGFASRLKLIGRRLWVQLYRTRSLTLACILCFFFSCSLMLCCRYVGSVAHLKPSVVIQNGRLEYSEVPRDGVATSVDYVAEMSSGRDKAAVGGGGTPYLRLLSTNGPSGTRVVDNDLTRRYLDALKSVCT